MFDIIYERNDDLTSAEFRNNPLFLRNQFLSEGTFEMPKIKKEEIDLENVELVGYDKLSNSNSDQKFTFSWTITNLKLCGKTHLRELKG